MTYRMTKLPLDTRFPRKKQQQRSVILRQKRSMYREEAQSVIELALMLPLFLFILVGSAEFARFAWASVLTSNAARAGATFGALSTINAKNEGKIQAIAASDSVNLSGLTTTRTLSCACSNGGTIADCSNAVALCPATVINYVQVNTTSQVTPLVRIAPLINYGGWLPSSFTATGRAKMVIEQ
jgi:Flp pilus assembly protein TadG